VSTYEEITGGALVLHINHTQITESGFGQAQEFGKLTKLIEHLGSFPTTLN